jgi:glycosyltransferase involved in cell wall biosynthesis
MIKNNNFLKYCNINSNLVQGNPKCENDEQISICIPAYKRTNLLKEAIESALNQKTIHPYKIIVIDDEINVGISETQNLITSYSDDKIVYYKNESNLGLFGNMNRCFQVAKTKYVTLLHDDDLLKDNYIEEIYNYIKRKDFDCLCVSFNHINFPFNKGKKKSNGTLKKQIKKLLFSNKSFRISDKDNYLLHRNIFGPPSCGVIFKRESCIQAGGWDEEYFPTADWFFMIDFNRKYKVLRIPESLALYRWESNTSLKPNMMDTYYQHTIKIVNSYINEKNFFYNEILKQIKDEYKLYNVEIKDNVLQRHNRIKLFILKLYQTILNIKYISFE